MPPPDLCHFNRSEQKRAQWRDLLLRNAHISQTSFLNEEWLVYGAHNLSHPDRSEQKRAQWRDLLLRNAHISQTSFLNLERFIRAPIELMSRCLNSRSLHCASLRSG